MSPEHAIEAASNGTVDLLLTDVVMPQMYGNELAERMVAAHPRLEVLFMTGYADPELMQSEADRLIYKPFSDDELLSRVHEALSR
jgi:two-component system cell cycle sensor histidine kinase/response regulator CckA